VVSASSTACRTTRELTAAASCILEQCTGCASRQGGPGDPRSRSPSRRGRRRLHVSMHPLCSGHAYPPSAPSVGGPIAPSGPPSVGPASPAASPGVEAPASAASTEASPDAASSRMNGGEAP
jgi:hypothetical protein